MNKWLEAAILFVIVIVAAFLRLTAVDWDEYSHYHPDERYISWVGTSVEWPEDWGTAFKPHGSTFNPFYWPSQAETDGIVLEQDTPRRFAYGHVPLYLGVAATRVLDFAGPTIGKLLPDDWLLTSDILFASELNEFAHIAAIGRMLAALFDVATVVMLFFLGRWLYGPAAGLLAAALLALSVMHIQLSHFFTADPFLTFFVVASLAFMVLSLRSNLEQRWRTLSLIIASVLAGLAIGSKFSAVLLVLPLAITLLLDEKRSRKSRALLLLVTIIIIFLTFSMTNPFAILDWTCDLGSTEIGIGPLEITLPGLSSCYLENVVLQGTMVRGTRDVPFARQYDGTVSYLYFIETQLRWGMGFLAGLAAFTGFGWAIWRAARVLINLWRKKGRPFTQEKLADTLENDSGKALGPFRVSRGEFVVLAWTVPFFLTTGALMVKFMRYLEPLTPFLLLYAAALLLSLPWRRARWILIAIVLIATGSRAFSFVNMYSQPHPWRTASAWIFENVEQGSSILNEAWDDPLPDSVEIGGVARHRSEFDAQTVNWLSGVDGLDDPLKMEQNLDLVAGADYLVLSSNRNYGVIPRLQERYPLSSQYYHLLFDGRLGFDVAYVGTRMPNLFGLSLRTDSFSWPGIEKNPTVEQYFDEQRGINLGRFDESFTVYDQPLVIILKNTGKLSAEEMAELFQLSRNP
jgi:hypothetical protein